MKILYKVRLHSGGTHRQEAVYYILAETSEEAKHKAINCFTEDAGLHPTGLYIEQQIQPYAEGIWRDFIWIHTANDDYTKGLAEIFNHDR